MYSTYTFVEKGGRIKIVLGIYSELPARIWDQSEMHSVLKTIPNFLLSLSLNNYFSPRITLSFGLTGKKKLAFSTPMWVFFVHNSCQEAFLHLDTNMSCRFKVQSLSDTCHVRSLEEVVLICADFRQGKKIGQKKKPTKKGGKRLCERMTCCRGPKLLEYVEEVETQRGEEQRAGKWNKRLTGSWKKGERRERRCQTWRNKDAIPGSVGGVREAQWQGAEKNMQNFSAVHITPCFIDRHTYIIKLCVGEPHGGFLYLLKNPNEIFHDLPPVSFFRFFHLCFLSCWRQMFSVICC